jgi:D-tyrosyl-tRNA(Tyr) deacylase
MKALIQRVSSASVTVNEKCIGKIQQGLLVLLGVEKNDGEEQLTRMCEKLLAYRVFSDSAGKMNLSVRDIQGQLLVVSQFTLAADTQKGLRPGFSSAAEPPQAKKIYEDLVNKLRESGLVIETGEFAANMQVALVNDGPVTFLLEI